MERSEFETKYVAKANASAHLGLEVLSEVQLYPYQDIKKEDPVVASAIVARVSDSGQHHLVVVSYRHTDLGDSYNIWCGDKFLEGRGISAAMAAERCERAVAKVSAADPKSLGAALQAGYSIADASGRCEFWTHWRKTRTLCPHTEHALAVLRSQQPAFLDDLKATYESAINGTVAKPAPAGTALEQLVRKVPVLLEGEQGSGKTWGAFDLARSNGYPAVLVPGHEAVEAQDLLGHYVPDGRNGFVWKDGGLAEAFRKATAGPVVLILDELLRIPQRQLSVLLTALTPYQGRYYLRVGRILEVVDGVGHEEELSCPVENLLVVATTNRGAQFAVEDLDPALAERFVPLRKDTTVAELTRILGEVVAERKFPAKLTAQLVSFYEKMRELQRTGGLSRSPTTRTLVRAVQWASSGKDVKEQLLLQRLLWVDRDVDGQPVTEQDADICKLIARIFP